MTLQTATKPTNGKAPARELKIPPPAFTEFKLHLVGTTPLIVDAFSEDAKAKLALSQSGAAKTKPGPRDPEREFEQSWYRRDDGTYGIPKLAFRKAISMAAVRMTEVKGTEALAAFQVATPDEYLELIAGQPTMRTDHVVRMGRGQLAYRAQFFPWAVVLPVKLDEAVVSMDQFVHIVYKAGLGVGIGNWRPEKKGDYGCWTIERVTDVRVVG